MDYEKKYKEANEKVAIRFGSNVAKEIFQDLYESEDERMLRNFKSYLQEEIESYTYDCRDEEDRQKLKMFRYILDWLEKQGEQNPTWSEEDEVMLQTTIDTLEDFSKGKLPLSDSGYDIAIAEIQWLKSLKPQSQWKPTQEQMEALDEVCNGYYVVNVLGNDVLEKIVSLYNDLKNLNREKDI